MNAKAAVTVLLFAVYTACASAGLLLFKHGWPTFAAALGDGSWLGRPLLVPAAGAVLYATSFLLWLAVVARMPLTVAYPVAIGLTLLAITAGAVHWLGETLTASHLAGALLVLAGIVLLSR
jgi:multidrug transporter EmrE-like cation transporter